MIHALKDFYVKKPKLAILLFLVVVGVFFIVFLRSPRKVKPPQPSGQGSIATPLGGEVGMKAYTEKLEEKLGGLQKQIEELKKQQEEQAKQKEAIKEQPNIKELMKIMPRPGESLPPLPLPPPPAAARIMKFTINQPQAKKVPPKPAIWVHLPMNSIVKGVLVTGVNAPGDSNALPVLIELTEAFYGPNGSRVPLKGCFALGKSVADLYGNTPRAKIQMVTIACVLKDNRVFESDWNGYAADSDGVFGIKGALVERTGAYFLKTAASAFISAMSAALAQAQTTQTASSGLGTSAVATNVTGNPVLYGLLSGLSGTANKMSSFFDKELEKIIPTVYVPAGKEVRLVSQVGLTIKGMSPLNGNITKDFYD